MKISKKLMKCISESCGNDSEYYVELYKEFKSKEDNYCCDDVVSADNLISLIFSAIDEMKKININESIILKYTRMGFAPILYYCIAYQTEVYKEIVIKSLVSKMKIYYENGTISKTVIQCLNKSAEIIDAYYKNGYLISNDITRETNRPLCLSYETLINLYKQNISNYRSISKNTIMHNCSHIRLLLWFLQEQDVKDVKNATFAVLNSSMTKIAEYYNGGLSSSLAAIKQFLLFLFEKGITADDFSITVPKPAKRRIIRNGFSDTEITKMLDMVDRKTLKGKRDYAILLVACKTGLRSIDIVNLKLQDINWRTNEISIIQQKTGNPLLLPLPVDVGSAIAEYILNARQTSDSKKIFLNYYMLDKDLNRKSITPMIKKYMELSGIDTETIPFRGMHSFRRSYGKKLLESGIDIDMINELLGHKEINSSKPYLAIDEVGLKKCGLNLVPPTTKVVLS